MNDDDLKELVNAARKRGKDFAPKVMPHDLAWLRAINDPAAINFIMECGGIPKKDDGIPNKERVDFIPLMAPNDLTLYFNEDVKNLFGDTYNVDTLYREVGPQYVAAFLKGLRFP